MADRARELLDRYEATGDERAFDEARRLFEAALAESPDSQLLLAYGYLLECHGRYALRRAAEHYERAIELDPNADKARFQLIAARAALGEADSLIALHEQRLRAAPGDPRGHRLLAAVYLAAHEHEKARSVIDGGLALSPDDHVLLAQRGELRSATGDPDGALADWRAALDPDGQDIGPAYSSAFLLEREGRYGEAVDAWRYILEYTKARGARLHADWPRRELERLRATQRELMTGARAPARTGRSA
jgi:tetratricopeptide (TPR) repeat protein